MDECKLRKEFNNYVPFEWQVLRKGRRACQNRRAKCRIEFRMILIYIPFIYSIYLGILKRARKPVLWVKSGNVQVVYFKIKFQISSPYSHLNSNFFHTNVKTKFKKMFH